METCKIKNLYNLEETIAKDLFEGAVYPWEVLPKISDFIKKLGATLSEEEYEKRGEDTTEEEKPVATATSEESTKEQTKTTTATKKDEQAKPKSATGTYNGFADTSSVEIEMPDGSYQTFMVNDEDLVNKLNDMDEGTKITFTYGAVEGQANMEILSIE